ncbi:MAG TPA: hypothetical protein VGR70_17505, partial [Stellaceae bacterium]|nr:hypothetical protein [Stellaceae bacterium]
GIKIASVTGYQAIAIASSGSDTLLASGHGDTLVGGSGSSTLSASGDVSALIAGAGDNTLIGSGAADSYRFGAGDGQAIIINSSPSNTGPTNELDFGAGIAEDQLWFEQSGNDLQIELMGTQSRVTVAGWFASSGSQLQEITTTDGMKLDSQVSQLVQAMATYAANNPGFDPTAVAQVPNDQTLQTAIAASWHQ